MSVYIIINKYNQNDQYQRREIRNVRSEDVPEIDKYELIRALGQTKNGKSPGEGQITSEMLKMGGDKILESVQILLNKCLREGKIPNKWQTAVVIMLYKKSDRDNINNYRSQTTKYHTCTSY